MHGEVQTMKHKLLSLAFFPLIIASMGGGETIEYQPIPSPYLEVVSNSFYVQNDILATKEVKVAERADFRVLTMRITAYAPLDPRAVAGMCHNGDPTSTASGKYPKYGMVATNALPFGTEIRIPELFGNQVFVVEDRMSSRYQNTIDILLDDQDDAIKMGVKWARVEVLQ